MSLTVNLKTNKGEVNNRHFEKNQGVSVYGTITGLFLPDPGAFVRLDVSDESGNQIFLDDKNASWPLADYDFYFITPNIDIRLNLTVYTKHPGGNVESVTIPIGVGNAAAEPAPVPKPEPNTFDTLILIGGVALIALLIFNINSFLPKSKKD